MKSSYILTTSLLAGLSSTVTALPATPLSASSSFTYNRTHFLLNGEPFQIIGGQMDPQRIPCEFWRDRLRKARAMGLNTIFPYVMWNMLEPEQGTWDNTGVNDIATFFRIAHEEDLKIILRPGPYICGERDWGGLPAWLATIPGMVVRTSNGPFLKAAELYFKNLAKDLAPFQINQGGPILMIQVENEYGSYGENHEYTTALRDMLRVYFNSTLYTNDGTEDWTLEGGSVPEVLAEIDGDPRAGFAALRKYITNPSQQGPLLDGEYYTHAPDQWGSKYKHGTTVGQPDVVKRYVDDLDYVLGNESASISLYMVHGGTNFGFSNGALWQNKTIVWTSSYDYGSPIDESGRTTELYHTSRETIQKYVPTGRIPDVPKDLPRMFIPELKLSPMANLFDNKGKKTSNKTPLTMEALGQAYGFTLYEYTATESTQGLLQPGDRPRDRILVYVNGVQQGVIDSQYQFPQNVTLNLQHEDKLQLLVENLGRVNYYSRGTPYRNDVLDPFKGIKGNITLDGKILEEWDMYSLGLEDISSIIPTLDSQELPTIPLFYNGSFQVNKTVSTPLAELDTYLAIPNGVKGNVWVNGFHLGRYWRVGPQQSLYLPGAVVKAGGQSNEVVVLELEPHMVEGAMTAIGYSERIWGNNPDNDCIDCI